jgi:hypothetical protein
VAPDDLSSLIAFGGDSIGVMWSNQLTGQFLFAVHKDGADDGAWSAAPVPATPAADDHINLKADAAGRVYAAVKYSTLLPGDPFLGLLVRDPATGTWSQYPIGLVQDSQTRPIVLLDEQRQELHVFYTGPEPPSPSGDGGGTIYEKTSPMGAIAFAPGPGSPVIRDATSPALNDVTSTKQDVDSGSGIVVLANNPVTDVYWHADIRLDGSTPPQAPPPPPAPPLAPRTSVFPAIADGQVKMSEPGHTFGALPSLRVRTGSDVLRSYLAFAVAGLTGPVVDAKLRLMVANGSTDGGDVLPVDGAWSESSLTWRNAPALGATPVGHIGRVAPGLVDVPLAASAITADGTYSFALAAASDTLTIYSSREGTAAPELVVATAPAPPAPPPAAADTVPVATPPPPPMTAPPAPRIALLTAARARREAARALRHRGVRRWRLSCRRVNRTTFACVASWHVRGRPNFARLTVSRSGARFLAPRHGAK